MLDKIFPKIHPEGYKFLIIATLITIIIYFVSSFLGLVSLVLTVWIYYFFRDPERTVINDDNYLVSPADGLVVQVEEVEGPKELNLENKKFTKVGIFMNVFDCHVNRTPCDGKISEIVYKPGKFLNASLDKASDENERNYVKMINSNQDELILVQIAGLIARRIVCEVNENDEIKQGDKFGIIRFGSRVDLYFENYKILVRENQKTVSGETLIARKIKND